MTKLRLMLSLAVVVFFIGCLTACSHSGSTSSTLVGTWNVNSLRKMYYENGAMVKDSTINVPTGYLTETFTADGRAINGGVLGADTVNYTYSGNTLHYTNNGTMYGTDEKVLLLDAHNLVTSYTDHNTAPPYDSINMTYSATR